MPVYAGTSITAAYLRSLAPQLGVCPTAQTIVSTSPVPVTGLAVNLLSGQTYKVSAWLVISTLAGTAQAAGFQFLGPASPSLMQMALKAFQNGGATAPGANLSVSSAGYNSGLINTQVLSASASITYTVEIEMLLATTAAGALTLGGALVTSNADQHYQVLAGSYLRAEQQQT